MKNSRSGIGAARSTLLGIISAFLVSAARCQGGQNRERITPEWAPFVELSRQAMCSDIRNRLFVIDQVLVLADHVGSCSDAAYSEVLFGNTVDDVLCVNHDSIGGPVRSCTDPSYEELFDTIITHLDEPDLGLGPNHTVQQLPL